MAIMILADSQLTLCTILLTFLTIFTLKYFFTKPPRTSRDVPPSPPSLPVIGHLHLLSSDHQAISFQSLATKHGPLLHLRLGGSRMLLVSSSSFASEVFKIEDLAFANRPEFSFTNELPYGYGNSGFFGAEYGDYWKFMKKLCMTQLFSPRQLERSRATRQTEIIKLCAYICDSAEKSEVVDMGLELMKMTNNSTCKMVMSTSCSESGGEATRIREMITKTIKLATKVSYGDVLGPLKRITFWLYGRQLVDVTLKYDELFEEILKDHEKRGNWDHRDDDLDFADLLLKVYQDDKAELKITRTQIKAFLLDLFIGGTISSTETMQWAIAELINHPDVFNKAREEINSALGNSCRLVDETDIPSLPYLQAVVKETLRLYPPSPVVIRKCRQNCKIKGYDIDQGMMVAINVYAVMRDPSVWDNPDEFRPERFLASSHDGQVSVEEQNFDYVAFGGGRRRCPGSTVALLLANTAVAAMVQGFDWKVGKNGDDDDAKVDVHIGAGMSLPMANPLNLRPVIHFNPFASLKFLYKQSIVILSACHALS